MHNGQHTIEGIVFCNSASLDRFIIHQIHGSLMDRIDLIQLAHSQQHGWVGS